MSQLKPDTTAIEAVWDQLKQQKFLPQPWWPRFVYHCTAIENAIGIIQSGQLLSRAAIIERGLAYRDIASREVISVTRDQWKQYVRLYFRPKTPTQYTTEGVRAKSEIKMDAHCPVPIAFSFEALPILTAATTRFSNGNVAKSRVQIGETADFLGKIPFAKVFHDGRIEESEKEDIIFHRNAEILIPDEMDLSNLRYVLCRSQAEMETLMQMLSPEAAERIQGRVGVDKKGAFFFRQWTYVDQATLAADTAVLSFRRSSNIVCFAACATITGLSTGKKYAWESAEFAPAGTLELNTSAIGEDYRLELHLDGNLIYRGECRWNEPFV